MEAVLQKNAAQIAGFIQKYAAIILVAAGWVVLFGPVYFDFANGAWTREENAHAPFIIAICIGIGWARLTSSAILPAANATESSIGLVSLAIALVIYAVGVSAGIDIFTSSSQFLVASAIVLSLLGWRGLKLLWFPLALTLYLVIWPGWMLDALTSPLKQFVSVVVSNGLFATGMPVAHAGAVISAGPYELLIADACAGLNSLIALTAVGAVYLFAVKRQSFKVNAVVLASLAPLAIAANIVRVTILVLITYKFGYNAGQSFLHEGAGLLMFAVALVGVFAIDSGAAKLWEPRP